MPTRSLLIVEPDAGVRNSLAAYVRNLGHQAHEAADGIEAVEIYRKTPGVTAALVDGVESYIALHNLNPLLPVILTTEGASRNDELRALSSVHVLHKPFRLDELARVLQDITPTFRRRAVPADPTSAKGCPPDAKGKVLVIEDNVDAAKSLAFVLRVTGHEVKVAYTGPDGVREADAWRPDAIICDIGLPGLDGYGVADELRRLSVTATAVLIAVTGYGSGGDREKSRRHGFDAHLVKPANIDELLGLLKRPAAG